MKASRNIVHFVAILVGFDSNVDRYSITCVQIYMKHIKVRSKSDHTII